MDAGETEGGRAQLNCAAKGMYVRTELFGQSYPRDVAVRLILKVCHGNCS